MVVSRFLGKGGRCRLLALCLFAAAIYLGFQLFSVKILSSDSQKKLKHIDIAKRKNYEKVLQKLNLPLKFPNRVKKDVIHAPLKETIVKLMNLKETNIKPPNIVQNGSSKVSNEITIVNMVPPVGINPDLTLQYLKDKNGIFTCLNSKETISWLHVNDDYCDCSDGSDEPGTSACRNMQFYCSKQLIGAPVFIPSSRVNDGICDCCDGSDEWSGATVADNFRIEKDKLRYLVVHAPCVSTCYRYKEASDEEKRIHKAGRKKKELYIKYAQSMPFMEHIHGPQGVFYKLNDNCYKFKQSKYTYELCPFRESKQSTNDGHSVNIGRVPALRKSDGNFVLEMNNGDNASCPGRNYRQTVMWFKCGLEDKIVHMKEDNSCIYEFDFETPAAC